MVEATHCRLLLLIRSSALLVDDHRRSPLAHSSPPRDGLAAANCALTFWICAACSLMVAYDCFELCHVIVAPCAEISRVGYFQHLLTQIVHFHESHSSSVVYTSYDRSIAACRQIRDDC